MKKFISLALAAMLAVPTVAFASNDYYYDVKDVKFNREGFSVDNSYGLESPDELYFLLEMTASDTDAPVAGGTDVYISDSSNTTLTAVRYDDIEDIDDLKVNIKFTDGEEYVDTYYIDEIDCKEAGDFDGLYAVIVELKDNVTTKKQKIKGEIVIKNKTKKLDERDFAYSLDVNKLVVEEGEYVKTDMSSAEAETKYGANYAVDTDGYLTYRGEKVNAVNVIADCEFDDEDVYINLVEFNEYHTVADFAADVKNIELEDNNGFYFDVKASDQGKLNLNYDNVAIKSVARIAPVDADLTFYNFYGYPEFDFTGKVTLTPEEDDVEYFVYSVAKDGKITKVNARLNEDGDAYEFKTRTLGCYVLSDMELDIEDEVKDTPVVEDAPVVDIVTPVQKEEIVITQPSKVNPGTGC